MTTYIYERIVVHTARIVNSCKNILMGHHNVHQRERGRGRVDEDYSSSLSFICKRSKVRSGENKRQTYMI